MYTGCVPGAAGPVFITVLCVYTANQFIQYTPSWSNLWFVWLGKLFLTENFILLNKNKISIEIGTIIF